MTLDQRDLIDIFRAFHHKAAENTFFPNTYGTFSRIEHMLGHITSLNNFKKIEIISSIFSNHNGMKLEINHRKKTEKHTKAWGLNYMLLHNEWVNDGIEEEIKSYLFFFFFFFFLIFFFLLLCNYSCMPFLPIPLPHPR